MNVWCDFFCVEEVHGKSDLIEMKLVTKEDAEEVQLHTQRNMDITMYYFQK